MSDVLRDYHFDSLKKFATTLKNSDWSEVNKEIADYYLQHLNKYYQQVLLDTRMFGQNSGLLDEAERTYITCKRIIDAHTATMRRGPTQQFYSFEGNVEFDLPPQPEDVGLFSGEFVDWCDFYDRFKSNVHSNDRLCCAEKLRRLLAAVTGKAAHVLGHWPIHDSQYLPAFNKLKAVYDNKYLIARSHLDAMEAQPPIDSTYESITELIGEIENMQNVFCKMEIPSGYWDPTIITIVEKRLDERTKENWTGIRYGDLTGMATISDMLSFLRGRALALPSTSGGAQLFWRSSNLRMGRTSTPPLPPKMETKTGRIPSGRKSMKNTDCYICQATVQEDQIECRDCPALVHFCCLKNASVVKNKKEARNWKCKKCLRCAECHSTNKIVRILSGIKFYDFTVFTATVD